MGVLVAQERCQAPDHRAVDVRAVARRPLQRRLALRAYDVLRPGGILVYSTCTFAPEENEAVVSWVLDQVQKVRLDDASLGGLEASPGLAEWNGFWFGSEMARCSRYYPHQNDTGGFFVAKLIKE